VKLREAGELDEAVTLLDEVVRRRTLALGPDNIEVLKPKASHEAMLTNLHRYAEAEETLEGTVAGLQRTLGPNDDTTRSLSARLSVAIFLHSAEEDAESQLLALDVLDANTRLDVEDHTTERARELLAAIDGTAKRGLRHTSNASHDPSARTPRSPT